MNKTKFALTPIVIAAVCGISVASAVAFTEFRAKSVPTIIKGVNKGLHIFNIPGAASPVECGQALSSGKVTKSKAPTQVDRIEYSKCFGFGALPSTISPAEYEFDASGLVTELNTVTIEGGGCVIVMKASNNKELKSAEYFNVTGKNKEVETKAALFGITEEKTAGGSGCGGSGKESSYKGTSLYSDAGVDLEVV